MALDIILIVAGLAACWYIFRVLRAVRPRLVNINVHTVPEAKQERIKRQILEEKLKRDIQKRWGALRNFFFVDRRRAVGTFFSNWYGKLKDLEQEYRRSRRSDLTSHVTKAQSIEERLASARQLMQEEEYPRAEQILLDCLTLDEHSIKTYMLLAQVYRAKGEFEHAKETLEYLLRLTNNSDPTVYSSLAGIARSRGDLQSAHDEYVRSISLDPKNHNYHIELAEVYQAMAQHQEAHDEAQKALTLAPNNPKILDFLIENSILLQDKNRAADYLSKLIAVNPQNGKIASLKERIADLH